MKISIFDKYPQLTTLRGLVPEEVVEREVNAHAEEFERWKAEANRKIKTVKLCDIFPAELEKGAIQLENFLGHWGNIGIEALCKIALIVKYFRPKTLFEFGTYNGMTTLQLALNTPTDSKIYTLDLDPSRVDNTKYQLTDLDRYVAGAFRQKFRTNVGSYYKGSSIENKVVQILSDSATYDYSPLHGKVDFVYIDAAHDYLNKKTDSENALKMLSPNGIIIWDNYDDVLNPFVTKYLSDISGKIPLFRLRGTYMVLYWNKK